LATPASASLGGSVASVNQDNTFAKGSLHTKEEGRYTIYEIRISTWATVREFVSPTGAVFAVCWQGQFVPDLKQFLGTYFEEYSMAVHTHKATRQPLLVQLQDLVFESSGHMGSHRGKAYDSRLLPDGVSEHEIK
jgi:hypothetical protein